MKGPKTYKRFLAKYWKLMKSVHYDSLAIMKFERDKKWRKKNRRARDGSYGTKEGSIWESR